MESTAVVPFIQQLEGIHAIEQGIMAIGEDSPEKAYLVGVALAKVADKAKKEFAEPFKNYYDTNKELPGGFTCTVRQGGKVYAFEENAEWAAKKAELDAIEEKLKAASDLKLK